MGRSHLLPRIGERESKGRGLPLISKQTFVNLRTLLAFILASVQASLIVGLMVSVRQSNVQMLFSLLI